mmetsp:Transcript_86122/g.263597  ORF Transcript_86122/g.263597 Transcript_86122/m.263597 type:complete len:480 (-) Transcript_86122:9-1448(-)
MQQCIAFGLLMGVLMWRLTFRKTHFPIHRSSQDPVERRWRLRHHLLPAGQQANVDVSNRSEVEQSFADLGVRPLVPSQVPVRGRRRRRPIPFPARQRVVAIVSNRSGDGDAFANLGVRPLLPSQVPVHDGGRRRRRRRRRRHAPPPVEQQVSAVVGAEAANHTSADPHGGTSAGQSLCSPADYGSGRWERASKPPPYPNMNCRTDRRDHHGFVWRPTRGECVIPEFHVGSLNACLRTRSIHMFGDSHYREACEALQLRCSLARPACTFKVICHMVLRLVPDFHGKSVDPALLRRLQHGNPATQILVVGTGHHYGAKKRGMANKNDTEVEAYALRSVNVFLSQLRSLRYEGLIVWNTYTPRHFVGAEWDQGGKCTFASDEPLDPHVVLRRRSSDLYGFGEERVVRFWDGVTDHIARETSGQSNFLINNITWLSLLRPGSHVANYSGKAGVKWDCSHFCHPGVPDTWNDMMLHAVCLRSNV